MPLSENIPSEPKIGRDRPEPVWESAVVVTSIVLTHACQYVGDRKNHRATAIAWAPPVGGTITEKESSESSSRATDCTTDQIAEGCRRGIHVLTTKCPDILIEDTTIPQGSFDYRSRRLTGELLWHSPSAGTVIPSEQGEYHLYAMLILPLSLLYFSFSKNMQFGRWCTGWS